MKGLVNKIKMALGYILYRCVFVYLPVNKNTVYFEAYWGKGYSCNPKAISQYMSTHYPEKKQVWSFQNQGVNKNVNSTRQYSISYFYYLATSQVFFVNANLPNFFRKRQGTVHIQTKHGTPLKIMGLDELEHKQLQHDIEFFEKRCKRWDYVISSNQYSSNIWKKAFPYSYELIESGYPRNDSLIQYQNDQVKIKAIREQLGINENCKVILYMPTIRDYQTSTSPYLDSVHLAKDLGDEYVILSRFHYLTNDNFTDVYPGNIIDVTGYSYVENLYLVSDLLITDYSSAMFDYSVLRKPILLYLFDYQEYKINRGIYLDIISSSPGEVFFDINTLVGSLKSGNYLDALYEDKLKKFCQTYNAWEDGQASKKVCDVVFR